MSQAPQVSKVNFIVLVALIFGLYEWTGARDDQLVARPHHSPTSQPVHQKNSPSDEAKGGGMSASGRGGEVAIFAGGCFWCVEASLESIKGVTAVISGYTGGESVAPTYPVVSSGQSDHLEAVWVEFDAKQVSYEALVEAFWRTIDPTQVDGQFADRGPQYLTAIFYVDASQKETAERSKAALSKSGRFKKPIYTPIRPAGTFWSAESYHQDYYRKNPTHYQRYKEGSGRGPFIRRAWGRLPKVQPE